MPDAPPAPTAQQDVDVTPTPSPQPAPARPHGGGGTHWGTGRRKSSVARVRVKPGSGEIKINRRSVEVYFPLENNREWAFAPLRATDSAKRFDIFINVRGGGTTGQSGAIRMGLARALMLADPSYEPTLRDAGFFTRDARRVERKKYGHRKARRSFQFSKR